MNQRTPLTPAERESLVESIRTHPSYRLAYEDADLLEDGDLRPLRLQLELLKPERLLRSNHVGSTIVVFGSSRVAPEGEGQGRPEERYSRYYEEARRFAEIVSRRFQRERRRDFVVVTGGGPGIMEAANRGAYEAGARSIGLNITLPHEQKPNPFVTPELCFRFRYFALRKMHFLLRARALVAFPGGYGTLDEVFETLTLVQTGKVKRMPVVLVGGAFWQRAIDFSFLVQEGMISPEDAELFVIVETAEEAVDVLQTFYGGLPPSAVEQ